MTRDDIHAMLEDALDETKEGEHFLPGFVAKVLEALLRHARD